MSRVPGAYPPALAILSRSGYVYMFLPVEGAPLQGLGLGSSLRVAVAAHSAVPMRLSRPVPLGRVAAGDTRLRDVTAGLVAGLPVMGHL